MLGVMAHAHLHQRSRENPFTALNRKEDSTTVTGS